MVTQEFKHLKADEKEIAVRFRNSGILTGEYEYDVELKTPDIRAPAHWTKKDVENWETLRAKRIDLVVHAPTADWVIEITPKLSKAAIGGVIGYRELYMEQYKPARPVNVAVVCELDDLAYKTTCERFGIKVFVV